MESIGEIVKCHRKSAAQACRRFRFARSVLRLLLKVPIAPHTLFGGELAEWLKAAPLIRR